MSACAARKPLAGILGYSGRLIAPELLASELRSRPPVLLVHGTEDPLVPFDSMAQAEAALRQAGVPVETLACLGIEHAIDSGRPRSAAAVSCATCSTGRARPGP